MLRLSGNLNKKIIVWNKMFRREDPNHFFTFSEQKNRKEVFSRIALSNMGFSPEAFDKGYRAFYSESNDTLYRV